MLRSAKMQAKSKRSRCPNWTTEDTVILANLKRQASLRGEVGNKVWKDISSRLSCKSDRQCRMRWETLTKVYNRVRDHCLETGQDRKDLSEKEFAFMKLETAYHPDWYTIVEEVCSQRNRSHSDQITPAALSRGSITGSVTLSTITEESVTTSPDNQSETKKTNERREESGVQLRREQMVSRGDTSPGEEAEDIFDCLSPLPFPAYFLPEAQFQGCLSSEQTVTDYNFMSNPLNQGGRYPECEKHYSPSLRSGGDVRFDSPPPPTIARYGVSRHESSDDLSKFMSTLNLSGVARSSSPSRDTKPDPKEDQRLSKPRVIELKVNLCCDECVRKVTKVLKGVEGPVTCDKKAMKVSVTATAVPEVVLELVRTVKKDADFWPESKPTVNYALQIPIYQLELI